MGIFKGGALRLLQTALYVITFCCSVIILGFFSYFLAANRSLGLITATRWKAVEGLSGAAVLYSICAILFTCCLGGVTVFAFLGLFLDVLFIGAMIAIAVITRDGAHSCNGFVNTPLGKGFSDQRDGGFGGNITYADDLKSACRYNKVCFAVSIIAAVIFLFTAIMQIFLSRHHKKEKRYGPSPNNGYTSGPAKRKFWQRKPKHTRDAELGPTGTAVGGGLAVPATQHHRASHETGYTGSTVGGRVPGNAHDKDASHIPCVDAHNPLNNNVHNHPYVPPTGTATNY